MKHTLYGLDKGGSYKVWTIEVNGNTITINHGKEGGKMQTKSNSVQGKNIGRSNETTPAEQALLEAQSKINKQIDKGYRDNKLELASLETAAMLAKDYHKEGHRIKYPCMISAKLDGVRCTVLKRNGDVTLKSRGGKIYNVPHINHILKESMIEGEEVDGELYLHGYELEQIVSAVKREDSITKFYAAEKKYGKGSEEANEAWTIHKLRENLEFHVFDYINDDVFELRYKLVEGFVDRCCNAAIQLVEHNSVHSEDDMKIMHMLAVGAGYEGIMLRNTYGEYESGKRSADLQKYKEFLDSEFFIIDVIPDKDGYGVFVCKNDVNEETFTVVLGSMAERADYLANKQNIIGNQLTVKYQKRYKDTLLPQFPTGVVIRDYEH